jgi:hypothetical protein
LEMGLLMALDVQPLSRGRRALMMGVLVALFAGSLGVAQWLTVRVQRERGVRQLESRRVLVAPPAEDE